MIGRRFLYLHAGARVRGLKKDPVSYLRNPAGLKYDEVKPAEYQDKIRQVLNFKEHGIELSDPVILQCFTHKSFAHGSRPYNEKLNLLGSQFLKLNASIHSVKEGNDTDFTQLGTVESRGLISHHTAANYIMRKQLDPLVFWKMSDLNNGPVNGKSKILSTVLNSIVGAIVLQQGTGKASQFVFEDLLNPKNSDSLLNISSKA